MQLHKSNSAYSIIQPQENSALVVESWTRKEKTEDPYLYLYEYRYGAIPNPNIRHSQAILIAAVANGYSIRLQQTLSRINYLQASISPAFTLIFFVRRF
jgi:hypothetical protein